MQTAMDFQSRFWRCDTVVDTRHLGDDRKPISGTGESRPCDCCGRAIEIHAECYNSKTGEQAVIGIQCCAKLGIKKYGLSASNKTFGYTYKNR